MPNIIETFDSAASTSTTYNLGIGQTAQGTLSVGDHDWWRVNLVAGQTYTFALVGTGGTHLRDPQLFLRDAAGTLITSNDDGGPGVNASITFTATSSGTYYLDAGAFGDDATGQYGLSAVLGTRAHYDEMMGAGNLIRDGYTWAAAPGTAVSVTYSIDTSNPDQTDFSGNPTPFIALSGAQAAAVAASLAQFSEAGNITFTQVAPDTGAMRFSAYNSTTDGAGAYAHFPFPGGTGAEVLAGDVNLNNDSVSTTNLAQGTYSFFAVLHEIGHAVGLAHPGDYNAGPGVVIEYDTHAQFTQDSHQYSVLSYFDESNTTDNYGSYPDTLMLFDILAIQQLYGVNNSTRSGNSIYGFGANTGSTYDFAINTDPALCIWDGGGIDTINASGYSQSQLIDLREGTFSDIGGVAGNVSIAYGAVIENAVGGTGSDYILGNAASNSLDGGASSDVLVGLAGNDTYYVDAVHDVVDESRTGSNGNDTVRSLNLSINLSNTNLFRGSVEAAVLSGAANLNLTGNGLNNYLQGNSGNNILDGGINGDTMVGLAGNDTYHIDSASDVVDENVGGSGSDIVRSSTISINLANTTQIRGSIESAVLSGSANLNLTGNSLSNYLQGNSGNNTLDGGTNGDTMIGLAGNDTYHVDSASDVVDESIGGSGNEIVRSSTISINLGNTTQIRGNVESAVLSGSANLNLAGSSLGNYLQGNGGSNVIDGGAGTDTLIGLGGNDVFRFTATLGAGNVDSITDYNVAFDRIEIDNAAFIGLANGALAGTAFHIGSGAADSSDRIIYNSGTGALFFDSDGLGGNAAVQFATVSGGLGMTASEFFVV